MYWLTYRLIFWLSVSRVSVEYRSSVGEVSVKCQSSDSRLSVDMWLVVCPCSLLVNSRLLLHRHITKRPG